MKKFIVMLIVFCFVLSIGNLAITAEEKYPTKPIILLVPYGAGGMGDTTARLIADKIKHILGQPVVVQNKKGAAGIVGTTHFLREKADGYTVLILCSDAIIVPLFQGEKEPLDPGKFKYIGSYMSQERVLFAQMDAPYKTWEEFVAYVKEHPGELTFGSGCDLWATAIMKSVAVKDGLKMKYVVFDSGADGSAAILGRHVNVCETGVGTPAYQAAKAGKLRILIDLSSGTVPGFPDVQNVLDKGYPFAETMSYGIVLRAETPEYIREIWENAFKTVMQDAELIDKMEKLGLTPEFVDGQGYEKVCRGVLSVKDLLEYIKVLEE